MSSEKLDMETVATKVLIKAPLKTLLGATALAFGLGAHVLGEGMHNSTIGHAGQKTAEHMWEKGKEWVDNTFD